MLLHTLACIVLDGKTADGEVGVAAGSDVGEGNALGERITGLKSRHFVGMCLKVREAVMNWALRENENKKLLELDFKASLDGEL